MKLSTVVILFLAFLAGSIYTNSKLVYANELSVSSATQSSEVITPTQITLFENVSLTPGQKISSIKVDVRKYSSLSLYIKATNGESSGISGVTKGTCYYLPDGEDANVRFTGYYIETQSTKSIPQQMTSDIWAIAGPNLICDISNNQFGSTNVSLYLYLMP